ncbi:hypothetical protein ANANG_G00313000 [Anguilla anguilla]|uniref:Uncharacterized protein n=1 Tax=Anguilla anguilla TaxID=7936 RepID=A0A9D3LIE7_ANGAN|nr:hypothetical protein ANANG_G00313000 [Anguilla anguilla]
MGGGACHMGPVGGESWTPYPPTAASTLPKMCGCLDWNPLRIRGNEQMTQITHSFSPLYLQGGVEMELTCEVTARGLLALTCVQSRCRGVCLSDPGLFSGSSHLGSSWLVDCPTFHGGTCEGPVPQAMAEAA